MVANGPEFSNGADKDAVAEESRASPALVGQLEKDRKIRREIANSNERRRMQSINAGFQTLRSMLPAASLTCSTQSSATSEKLSKATILQQAASFIKSLEDDKRQLLERYEELQQQQQRVSSNTSASVRATTSPQPHAAHQLPSRLPLVDSHAVPAAVTQQQQPAAGLKRRKRDTESSDEGIALAYTTSLSDEAMSPLPHPPQPPPSVVEEMRRELQELRAVLEAERQRCGTLERCCAVLQERLQERVLLQAAPATTAASLPAPAATVQSSHHPSVAGAMAFARDDRCPTVSRCIPAAAEADHDRSRAPLSSRNLQMIVEAIQHLEGGGVSFAEQSSPPPTPRGSVAAAALAEPETRDASGGSRASKIRRTGQATLLRSASEPTPSAAVAPSCGGIGPATEFAAAAQPTVLRQQPGLFYRPTFMANVPTIVEHMATSGRR